MYARSYLTLVLLRPIRQVERLVCGSLLATSWAAKTWSEIGGRQGIQASPSPLKVHLPCPNVNNNLGYPTTTTLFLDRFRCFMDSASCALTCLVHTYPPLAYLICRDHRIFPSRAVCMYTSTVDLRSLHLCPSISMLCFSRLHILIASFVISLPHMHRHVSLTRQRSRFSHFPFLAAFWFRRCVPSCPLVWYDHLH